MKRQKECMQTPATRRHPATIYIVFNYTSFNMYATVGSTSRLSQPSSIKGIVPPLQFSISLSLEVGLARSPYAYIH